MEKTNLKATDIIPRKCGIVLSPSAVLYIYEIKSTKKLRKLLMPINNLPLNSDIEFLAADLKLRHKPLLDSVNLEIIKKMIFLLQQHKKGLTLDEALIKFDENENKKNTEDVTTKEPKNKNLESDLEDDFADDIDFDDLDAPIDKLGIYSDDDGDQFWQ